MVSSWYTKDGKPQCFIHTWYVEADIYFTVVTLPVLFMLYKIPKSTMLALVLYSVCRSYHFYKLNLEGKNLLHFTPSSVTTEMFKHAWTIGLFIGCLKWKYPNQNMPRPVSFLLWCSFYMVCVFAPMYIVGYPYGNRRHIQLLWVITNYCICWALYSLANGTQYYLNRC